MAIKFGKILMLAGSVLLGIGIILISHKIYYSTEIRPSVFVNSCSASLDCTTEYITREVKNNPASAGSMLDSIWHGRYQNGEALDLRKFSPLAHAIGMQLIEQKVDIVTAMHYCGYSFKGACMHGAVMEYIDGLYPGSAPFKIYNSTCDKLGDAINARQYLNCIHAIGHEVRAKTTGSNSSILGLCDYFKKDFRDACASGVLMEASKGNSGYGYHLESDVGVTDFDCFHIPAEYEHICYSSLGSYIEYQSSGPSWQSAFGLCASVPARYQADCFAGVDERLLMAQGTNTQVAQDICQTLPAKSKAGCLMVKGMTLDSLQ